MEEKSLKQKMIEGIRAIEAAENYEDYNERIHRIWESLRFTIAYTVNDCEFHTIYNPDTANVTTSWNEDEEVILAESSSIRQLLLLIKKRCTKSVQDDITDLINLYGYTTEQENILFECRKSVAELNITLF